MAHKKMDAVTVVTVSLIVISTILNSLRLIIAYKRLALELRREKM